MNSRISVFALAVLLSPLACAASEPLFYMPLDGSADVVGSDGGNLKGGVVHGKSGYVAGVSGKALEVKRHAYDQVTAVNFAGLPEADWNEGTVSFWFKPFWKETDPESIPVFTANGKNFRFYFVKGKGGYMELSVCPPRQLQILRKNVLKQGEWAHVAFSWSTKTGEAALYINGRLAGKKADPSRVEKLERQSPSIWLGNAGSDRFKAKVGNGLYDEIRIFDRVLPAAEIFALSTSGSDSAMSALNPDIIPFSGGSAEFVTSGKTAKYAGPRKLLELDSGSSKLSLVAMGASGKVSFVYDGGGKKAAAESACVLNLAQRHKISVRRSGESLEFYIDDSFQGSIPNAAFDKISSAKIADGFSAYPNSGFPSAEDAAKLADAKTDALEDGLWSLEDAARRSDGARSGVCLNGYWRVWLANEYSYAPEGARCGYMRVPGSFRSPLYNLWLPENGKLGRPSQYWNGKSLIENRAGWYQRVFEVPDDLKGERVYLNFENLNGDYGRVYLNGKLIDSFRQDFKCFTVVPNARRIDVTDILSPDGKNLLTVFIDRAYVGLWRGVPSIGDHAEIAIGDVWLEKSPSRVFLSSALALPSYREGRVAMLARVQNPSGLKGAAKVEFSFERKDGKPKTFSEEFDLTGAREQAVKFSGKWKNPVLWDVENPNLYEMKVSLYADSKLADSYPAKDFGFREAWVEGSEFRMNGKKMRMRMWTSPALGRLRQYFGHPNSMGQYVAHIKDMNYDTVRFDPFGKTSQVAWPEYLRECDRAGLYNLFQMPPYEDEEMEVYSREVERFLEHYGNHPSILMWYTDFNTCSYPWNQDPAKITDYDYDPPSKREPRRRAQTAERLMRSLDWSRELFQHAGGASGKIFTSMNYQSYGTPLQEQEDWPRQWSEKRGRPLMVVESAFPYPAQIRHFDNPSVGSLGAEHAARYFGDGVFSAETNPVPHSDEWQYSPYANPNENIRRLSEMLYGRVVKAWRGYDMSALGDFPGGRDMCHTAVTYDNHNVVFDQVGGGGAKSPGLRPDNPTGWSETQRHLLSDYTLRANLHDAVRDAFEPLLIFIGGEPANFTSKDHAFYAGEKFSKSVVVVNDRTSPQTVSFKWELRLDGEPLPAASGEFEKTVEPGGLEKFPIALAAPGVAKRTDAVLSLEAFKDGVLIKEDSFALQFFPKRVQPDFRDASVALYDPKGNTAGLLEKAGMPFRKIKSFGELADARLLIVGQNALGKKPSELLAKVEEEKLIDRGLKVLVFEQKASANVGNFVFESPSYRNAFIRSPKSPYVAGLKDADLANWRGSSDTVEEYVVSDENSPHYPRSKWKCGNGGIVSGNVIRKPSYGNFTAVVDCGFNLMHSSLLEMRRGHGIVLFCQLDVTSRYGKDPAATLLADNILKEMSNRYLPVGPQRAAYAGGDAGAKILDRMGMEYSRVGERDAWNLSSAQVIVLGADAPKKLADAVRKIASSRNSVAVVALPGADIGILGSGAKIGKKNMFRASVPKNDPLFDGIADADLYFRTARELPVIENAPDWMRATSPALFGAVDKATGANICFTVAPSDVSGVWNEEKVARVWNGIFDNMNVGLGKDLKLFSSEKYRHNKLGKKGAKDEWSPYVDNLDFYDGDAFHNW